MEGSSVVNRAAAAAASAAPSVSYPSPKAHPSPFSARGKKALKSVLAGFQSRSKLTMYSPALFFFLLGVAATLLVTHHGGNWGLQPRMSFEPANGMPRLLKEPPDGAALLVAQQKGPDDGILEEDISRRFQRQSDAGLAGEVAAGEQPGHGADAWGSTGAAESLTAATSSAAAARSTGPTQRELQAVGETQALAEETASTEALPAAAADSSQISDAEERKEQAAASGAGGLAVEGSETEQLASLAAERAARGTQENDDAHGGGEDASARAGAAGVDGEEPSGGQRERSLAVFAAPTRPYTQQPSDPQRRALLSWLGLRGFRVHVSLFGDHPSLHQLAAEFPGAVSVERQVDANLYGVPQVHSMLARAAAAGADLAMLVASDTALLGGPFGAAVEKAGRTFGQFVITGVSWEVDALPPDAAPLAGAAEEERVADHIAAAGQLRTGGHDATLWLWSGADREPLVDGAVPPFAYGRGAAEGWITAAIVRQGRRHVVDASGTVLAYRVRPAAAPKAHVKGLQSAVPAERRSLWGLRRPQPWEVFANARLAEGGPDGGPAAGAVSHLHAPWHLIACHEPAAGGMCLVKRTRPGNCSCELAPYAPASETDARPKGKHFTCGVVPAAPSGPVDIPAVAAKGAPRGLPHRVQDLLPLVANEQKVVVMVGVNMPYAEMLMSFVCRLRQLAMPEVLVTAMDEDLYKFAFLEGLAVYYEPLASSIAGVDQKKCHYGSDCFKKLTKLKSRAVVRVLRLGYNVLWTDVDIMWFRDPLPELLAYGPGTLPVQSNEPNATKAANSHHCINSGFYFARAEPAIIAAFDAVIEHAAKSKGSEQPSFWEVLCGSYGRYRKGPDECYWPLNGGLRVMFLPRDLHPNGWYKILWGRRKNVTLSCEEVGCATLHNNWIIGRVQKEKRFRDAGFWFYDAASHLCTYAWTRPPKAPARTPAALPA